VLRSGTEGGVYAKTPDRYGRGDLKNKLWSSPHLLCRRRPGPSNNREPRILSLGNDLHVIVSDSLRHFVSSDEGATWEEGSPLLPQHFGLAQSIDVASTRILDCRLRARRSRAESDLSEPPKKRLGNPMDGRRENQHRLGPTIGERTPWSPLKLRRRRKGNALVLYSETNWSEFTKQDFDGHDFH